MNVKNTALRLAGAAMITLAVAPWLGGGTASAAATDDSDCSTRPADVPATATCVILDDNPGSDPALHGETWAWRDANNDLHVNAYPVAAIDSPDAVQLCVQEGVAYSADFKCLGNDPTRVFVGDDLSLVIDLDALNITPADSVFYSIHVNQGGRTTVSSGNGGSIPTVTTSSSVVTTPATVTTTPAKVNTPASVLATTAKASPAVSVKGTKAGTVKAVLPHTGSGLPVGVLLATSVALLLGGGALLMLPGLAPARGKRRRH
jgi:hypothetical protein